jgi:membrane-associated phospholipid phosphatase
LFRFLTYITLMYLPYLLIVIIYENLILFNEAFSIGLRLIDFSLMQIDAALFGIQPTIWLQYFINPVAVEYFMMAYNLFFIYPFFYLIYLLQKNETDLFNKVLLAQIIAVIVSLTSFLLFPAIGPRFTLDPASVHAFNNSILYSQKLEGIVIPFLNSDTTFYSVQVDMWNNIERINTDCFPSLHTCLCLLCLIYALKYRRIFKYTRLAVWFWTIGVTSLVISTVYLRYHWVIDVIAGTILAIVVFFISEITYQSWHNLRMKHGLISPGAPWVQNEANLSG